MAVRIDSVIKNSLAYKTGIRSGYTLISINGKNINDFLDYQFYMSDEDLKIVYADKNSTEKFAAVSKGEYDDFGLVFDSYLMDKERRCKNKCIFCFIDQMPCGLRESLYFKDDDLRLGFLFGNYITLTNLLREDVDRIIKMRISPVNISVHTTNPELRVKMMKNPHAGNVLKYIEELADANISMNFQLVLCPGINDGDELKKSLFDLGKFYPSVESIACVPVGITSHREGLEPLVAYDKSSAENVLRIIEEFSDGFLAEYGTRLVYPSDEFFLKAGRKIPDLDYYDENLSQLENGVGMSALFKHEFLEALEEMSNNKIPCEHKVNIATGYASYDLISELIGLLKNKIPEIKCEIFPVRNDFFGDNITVSGLITGTDLINQLKGRISGKLLIPGNMLKRDSDVFLDGITVEQVAREIGIEIIVAENAADGRAFLNLII